MRRGVIVQGTGRVCVWKSAHHACNVVLSPVRIALRVATLLCAHHIPRQGTTATTLN